MNVTCLSTVDATSYCFFSFNMNGWRNTRFLAYLYDKFKDKIAIPRFFYTRNARGCQPIRIKKKKKKKKYFSFYFHVNIYSNQSCICTPSPVYRWRTNNNNWNKRINIYFSDDWSYIDKKNHLGTLYDCSFWKFVTDNKKKSIFLHEKHYEKLN